MHYSATIQVPQLQLLSYIPYLLFPFCTILRHFFKILTKVTLAECHKLQIFKLHFLSPDYGNMPHFYVLYSNISHFIFNNVFRIFTAVKTEH